MSSEETKGTVELSEYELDRVSGGTVVLEERPSPLERASVNPQVKTPKLYWSWRGCSSLFTHVVRGSLVSG